MRRFALFAAMLTVGSAAPAAAQVPREVALTSGWEMRTEPADPATGWTPVRVPGVFDTRALPALFPGQVRRYRVAFRGPATPRGFRWLIEFESVRRAATVFLNGRRLGRNSDPYTPFKLEARGLRPGRRNELEVLVDGRKNPQLREAWWNWSGIVRPVRLVPAGPAYLDELGTLSDVGCRGPATRCRADLLLDAELVRRGRRQLEPTLTVDLRAPAGRRTRERFTLPEGRARRERVRLELRVPAPELWSPDAPRLYRAKLTLRAGGRVVQVERRRVGLRSVSVRGGLLHLNNRRVQLRGASIHEDMPGSGAALTDADMDRIISDLKALGANVTRAHYLLNERLLARLDRAGIMVWSQAPIWQRDAGAHLLWQPRERERALETVRRTVSAARSHPSVLTHSVANELSFTPDRYPGTRRFLLRAQAEARELDPTLPISVDIKGRPGFPEQFTLQRFDMLGLNQYFGWYRWVEDFSVLEPYIFELRDHYPDKAIVMTEWGAEARPELAAAALELKGSYLFQDMHARRTLDVIDRSPVLSGAIYWTLREFEINPGWQGGAGRRPPPYEPNTRHHKGLLSYSGEPKPAYWTVRERFQRTPLYP